ncbi:trihydroxytoluene oxygenase [Xylariaceae sp. FL0594]|nr:trihydroxytoluene oxygenase [Xylariaceae sp. FL0594]
MATQLRNEGSVVPDLIAVGRDQEDLQNWRTRNKIDPEQQIKLVKISHMRYQHPDLDEIIRFLVDFGMIVAKRTDDEAWLRGYGPDQYVYYARKGPKEFLGGTFVVESSADLARAARLPGSSDIQELVNSPGGGFFITVRDPEGFPINLICGQQEREPLPEEQPKKLVYNFENEKPRVREFLRFKPGPAAIHKLGHYGLCVQDFPAQLDFYLRNFNLVPTDFLYVDDESEEGTEEEEGTENKKKDVAVFAHIDRGDDYVDHHTFFMSANKTSHVHHCSFEVHDYDTQMLGHQWLAARGYEPVWGVGRHILGSQIFDYWWDTTHNMIEHYIDGDVVNQKTPIGYGPAGDESLAVWGPEVPKWFLD